VEEDIGKYAIMRELGSGATSKVYLALDTFNNQQVAIKVIDQNVLANKATAKAHKKMLQNEASLVGKLQHPHIVQMLDAVLTDEQSLIVMEYVDGGSLEQYVNEGWLLQFNTVAEHMFKACKALEYAYEMGLIHRDIKPANIMLHGGEVKISDLGAATFEDADSTQVIGIGSPYYMSPEQITGEMVTFQTDIYSLGVTMYQLLTGKLPYLASSHAGLIFQIVEGKPKAPREIRPEVPAALEAIVLRAMQRDPAQRYTSWGEFAHDLSAFLMDTGRNQPALFDAEKFDALRAMQFFDDFNDAELWELLPFSKWRKVESDTVLLQEGDRGNSFYLLADGVVKVTRAGKVLDFLRKGDCFGEMRRVPHSQYSRHTGVMTGNDCVLFEVNLSDLQGASLGCRYKFSDACLLYLLRRLELADKRISKLVGHEANYGDATQKFHTDTTPEQTGGY
jgi:serine/threonine protein kinase